MVELELNPIVRSTPFFTEFLNLPQKNAHCWINARGGYISYDQFGVPHKKYILMDVNLIEDESHDKRHVLSAQEGSPSMVNEPSLSSPGQAEIIEETKQVTAAAENEIHQDEVIAEASADKNKENTAMLYTGKSVHIAKNEDIVEENNEEDTKANKGEGNIVDSDADINVSDSENGDHDTLIMPPEKSVYRFLSNRLSSASILIANNSVTTNKKI